MENLIKTGARKDKANAFRKWISKIAAPVLVVFPVPGENFFRSRGIYLIDYFDIATNPREANVLLVSGAVSEELAKKIAVVYLQMPRPRALVFAGTENVPILPEPDFQVDLNPDEIRKMKPDLIKKLKNAYRNDATAFQPGFVKKMMEEDDDDGGHEHHHHGHQHGGNGEEEENHEHAEHGHHDEDEHKKHHRHEDNHENHQREGHDHHSHGNEHKKQHQHEGNHEGHNHGDHESHEETEHNHEEHGGDDHESHEHGGHDHGGHDHGGHDHGSMGFMSMVEMTKDMPRATDGLAMERNNVWFGPFFPGLTGGLAFQFTIDGDTVVEIKAEKELFSKTVTPDKKLTPDQFLQEITNLNPLLPKTYRILGEQLLKKSAGQSSDMTSQQIVILEKERIVNHLNWLSTFAILIGNQWMEIETARQLRNFQNGNGSAGLKKFIAEIQGFKLLRNKLKSAGEIPEVLLHHTSGPIARAAGKKEDVRSLDENYISAGFESITLNENNAWGRLQLRLLEIEQSLDILQKLENETGKSQQTENYSFGESTFPELEGPAGIMKAELQSENGKFKKLTVTEASAIHMVLAEQLVKETELSDALVTIASLDINPFAVTAKCMKLQNK